MEGRHARLEPLSPGHAAGLFAAFEGAPQVWTWMPIGPFEAPADYAAWVEPAARTDDPLHFAVRMADGRLGGTLSYLRIAPGAGSIEIGWIVFSPLLQRTLAATEAVYLMMQAAFDAGYRRVEWKCDARNLASRRAAQRFGLSWEGVFRQAAVVKGRNRDTAWFAAIDAEWPALREAYEAWRDPANFDGGGRQRSRLSDVTRPILVARDPLFAAGS